MAPTGRSSGRAQNRRFSGSSPITEFPLLSSSLLTSFIRSLLLMRVSQPLTMHVFQLSQHLPQTLTWPQGWNRTSAMSTSQAMQNWRNRWSTLTDPSERKGGEKKKVIYTIFYKMRPRTSIRGCDLSIYPSVHWYVICFFVSQKWLKNSHSTWKFKNHSKHSLRSLYKFIQKFFPISHRPPNSHSPLSLAVAWK